MFVPQAANFEKKFAACVDADRAQLLNHYDLPLHSTD